MDIEVIWVRWQAKFSDFQKLVARPSRRLPLLEIRNALAHFRTINDPSHLDRRAVRERRSATTICEDDARFAITLFVRILAKPAFGFSPDSP